MIDSRIQCIDSFRAVAIIFIVAGHCIDGSSLSLDGFFEGWFRNVVQGGTAFFVFISGYMYYKIFYKRVSYGRFLLKKLRFVLAPFLFLGLVPILIYTIYPTPWFDGYFLTDAPSLLSQVLVGTKYLVTGRFFTAYWYIPFILATFALAPLHERFIRLGSRVQWVIVVVLSLISMAIHRPIGNLSLLQHVVYFQPVYLLGLWYTQRSDNKKSKLWIVLVGAAGLVLSLLQTVVGDYGNYHKEALQSHGFDLMYLQKLLLCLALMELLRRIEFTGMMKKLLDKTASTSFAVFFLHPIIIFASTFWFGVWYPSDSWLFYIAYFIAVIAVSLAIAVLIKHLAPRISRYLIGY